MNNPAFRENKKVIDEKRAATDKLTEWLITDAAEKYTSSVEDITPDSLSEFYFSAFGGEILSESFSLFCRKVADISGNRIKPFPDYTEESDNSESSRITYIKNKSSDKAYSVFAGNLHGASAIYGTSFGEICEDVYAGRSDFALLPVYTSRDGCLSQFRRLIRKYDLKIAYETEIETEEDEMTRFALVRRGLLLYEDSSFPDQKMLVSIIPEFPEQLMTILSSIKATGASIFSVNTFSAEYSANESEYDISFTSNGKIRAALWLFLESTHIRYTDVENYIIF